MIYLQTSNYHRNRNRITKYVCHAQWTWTWNTSIFILQLNQMLLISLSEALIYMAPATEKFRLRGGGRTSRGKGIALLYCWQQGKLWIRACEWQLVLFISMQECIKSQWQGQHCTTMTHNINRQSSYLQSKKNNILGTLGLLYIKKAKLNLKVFTHHRKL